jgi:hypothetical protein
VIQIRQRLKEAQDRQKSYADARRTDRSYKVGDQVFIRIRPNKSTIRFGKGAKLSARFIGPFKIQEKIGPVAYRLVLPPSVLKTGQTGTETDWFDRFDGRLVQTGQ